MGSILQTQQQMQEKTTSVAVASAAVGLNIHKEKSKILEYSTTYTNLISYLGSIINEHGGFDADVKARICKARATYLQLKDIWYSEQLFVN
ncbi:unnamed protein product [Schistosoma margrebowiei]|uniref:Uncharacterized protein n=1 Tax=Schistosoma margrebowiei TaxID=48269 RepID=A0A183MRM3_9TREM|nr:unnamed protein product [Schistosoma margrebowiei]